MKKAIYLDMDGTFVDLYGVENWLSQLRASNPEPYKQARPLCNLSHLARALNKKQRAGYSIGIVSWTSKNGASGYNAEVKEAKKEWLAKHLPSVRFDECHIVEYGTPKGQVVKMPNGVLFDDEEKNRNEWRGTAYDVKNLVKKINELY